jgi:hypothetical protein
VVLAPVLINAFIIIGASNMPLLSAKDTYMSTTNPCALIAFNAITSVN